MTADKESAKMLASVLIFSLLIADPISLIKKNEKQKIFQRSKISSQIISFVHLGSLQTYQNREIPIVSDSYKLPHLE